jgi:arsenate reductase (thioredoxin)
MKKFRILFLCVHNSARSQMAEAFLIKYGSDLFDVMSAGLEPGQLNPNVVKVMSEIGIDISQNKTKSAFELYKQNMMFSYVISVCEQSDADRCPIFPGVTMRLHWPFMDPSAFTGTEDQILEKTRIIRDLIKRKVRDFTELVRKGNSLPKDDFY